MNLNEFVKTGITQLITDAARLTANETGSPDEALRLTQDEVAAIPLAFFALEMELQRAWDKAIAKRVKESAQEAQ